MSIRHTDDLTAKDYVYTAELLPQIPQNKSNEIRSVRVLRLVSSGLLAGLLAFTGGFGFAAIQDLTEDGRISFLSNG